MTKEIFPFLHSTALNFHQLKGIQSSILFNQNPVETNSRKVVDESSSVIIKNSDRSSKDEEENKRGGKIEDENNWESSKKENSNSNLTIKKNLEVKGESEKRAMLSNPIENPIHYSREQDLRYTSLSEVSRSISSYAVDTVSSNRLSMTDYDVQSIHPANHRPYDPGSLVNSQTAFERYDPNYLQRTSMYASYSQPSIEDLANQQKYLLEHSHHHNHNSDLKTEPDDSPGTPIYPRPIYQSYDPTGI